MDWSDILATERQQPYFTSLLEQIQAIRASGVTVYPAPDKVFRALKETPLEQLKVIILGQDPYHGPGQAEGLSFSVPHGVKVPPSLVNIYKELAADIPHFNIPNHGHLGSWAHQGVLLLNSVLTVEQGKAQSHHKLGWQQFTDVVIQRISECTTDKVFLLWGSYAQKKGKLIDSSKHKILESVHPSPLSAHRGFFGCRHFSMANEFLERTGQTQINWQLADQ